MKTYPDYNTVQKCLLQIEEKLGWGSSAQWHSEVFFELSETIKLSTNVLLSPTTLKRIWGKVNYKSAPSISTLNALAEFVGYENWREYKNAYFTKKPNWIERKIHPNLKVIVPSAAILALIFISLFSMIGNTNNLNNIDVSKIEFSCYPVVEDVPNSVVFDFNLNGVKSDSLYIQQFWDETKTIKINSNQKQATGIYYYPGYFRAKLLVDGTIIKEEDLFIKSKGWLATIDYTPIPKYLKDIDNLTLPLYAINEIKNSEQPLTSTFHYVKDFKDLSGDNFRLKTNIRTLLNNKWAVCQNASIIIVGTKSAHIIPFAISGCSSTMAIMMSDVYLSGKENDLSALTIDLSDETAIIIEAINKQITVFSGDKKLFSKSYNESIGKIVGLRYRFKGAGEVTRIALSNLSESEFIIKEDYQ